MLYLIHFQQLPILFHQFSSLQVGYNIIVFSLLRFHFFSLTKFHFNYMVLSLIYLLKFQYYNLQISILYLFMLNQEKIIKVLHDILLE